MALFTYSARSLKLNMGGAAIPSGHTISGYAPDEFLTIETEDDDWTTEEGADGFVVRSMIPNKISKITLTLQQTSPSNKVLTAMYNIGKGLGGIAYKVGADVFQFTVREPVIPVVPSTGATPALFSAPHCYISKIAPMNFGKESGTRAWEITAVDGTFKQDLTSALWEAGANGVRGAMSFVSLVNK